MAHSPAHAMYFAFKRTSGQLNSKDFGRVMTRAEQATTTLKRNLLNIFRKFYQRNLRLSFLDWEPYFFQVPLDWSRRNLSLPTKHLFWIRFHQSAKWLSLVLPTSARPSLCASILVLFSIIKLIVELFFCKKKYLLVGASDVLWTGGSWFSGSVRDVCMSHQSDWIYYKQPIKFLVFAAGTCNMILLFVSTEW